MENYYKLYGDVAGMKELDRSTQESEIVSTILDYIKGNSRIHFIIIYKTPDEDIIYRVINNQEELEDYLIEFRSKTSQLDNSKIK